MNCVYLWYHMDVQVCVCIAFLEDPMAPLWEEDKPAEGV